MVILNDERNFFSDGSPQHALPSSSETSSWFTCCSAFKLHSFSAALILLVNESPITCLVKTHILRDFITRRGKMFILTCCLCQGSLNPVQIHPFLSTLVEFLPTYSRKSFYCLTTNIFLMNYTITAPFGIRFCREIEEKTQIACRCMEAAILDVW